MSETPGVELAVFLGGMWAAGKGMLEASSFVNDLRDTVVTGTKSGTTLTVQHRRVLRIDWLLTMIGTVLFPIVYSALLFVIADRLSSTLQGLHVVLLVVSVVPLTGSILFTCCGVIDWRLMTSVLRQAEETNRSTLSVSAHTESAATPEVPNLGSTNAVATMTESAR